MGLFDFLKKKEDGKKGSTPPPADKKVAGHAKVAGDKRAQTYDRMESLQALAEMKTPDSAAALLKRFSFSIDPSITDSEEKELAFAGIVEAGRPGDLPKDEKERDAMLAEAAARRDKVVEATRTYCEKAEQLTWPLKVLRELLDDDAYRDELIDMLARFDTEYARNVEPKIQLLVALEEVPGEESREVVEQFLEDVNETVRFHAAESTFAHGNPESAAVLCKMIISEESVRVKNKVAEGFTRRGWTVPADQRDSVTKALRDTESYRVDASGKVVR
ncbi:MAG: HEAT repeat domain-containing protein [Polyangiaceae bacterium]|nr:HEAT repeat domain-containing protein [Polyangiaceae bacterium]